MNKEEAIENLKKYINEDFAYREPIKNMSDFDRFCYNHCKDIDTVLDYIEKLENMYNKEHNEHIEMKRQNSVLRNNERILKEKIEELEIYKNEFKKVNKALNLEEGTIAPYTSDVIESLKRCVTQFQNDALNNIPKQKIRDKIEEWDKSIKWNNADDHYYAIKILKELLEVKK